MAKLTTPDTQTAPKDRRTSGIQKQGRAAKVVNDVLRSTCEELNNVGYAALRVEDVAEKAGVNKTTIYRRWPTKNELVIDAIRNSYIAEHEFPDSGVLREDLIQYLRIMIRRTKNPMARGAMIALNNSTDPGMKPLADELLGRARRYRTLMVQRGIDRGELPEHTDAELISDLFSAPILRRLLTLGEPVKLSYIDAVVDTVLAGAKANPPKRKRK
ncbi:TetR/AcrR family transcriptional regulator [Zhongshania aquimaris]|uniref:TetR/AcrR family transcriptional regulator n=1 Tax=Zhongshania aquimaris TaxID=2857107 RepID=A0ABS6VWJ6_9GAMM|nr:TetR/AcrR family transcriptional regulator [Zhongshania aquimaris]MBW2942717.1 TetR/AcrR family transcriptional regulator [Zhongshania aquimaris]